MKALDLKRSEKGDIAEKLRVEETKAQLAAAREGMEREAQRIKEEKEKKEQEKVAPNSRFGAAAAGMAGGSKWVPPHMRGGGGGGMMSGRPGWGAGPSTKVDTQDENLFPDLASADAIIEQQKSQQPAFKVPKKTPVGGGATWGSRMKKKLPEQRKVENGSNEGPSSPPAEEPKPAEPAKTEPAVAEASSEPAKAATAAPAKAPVKPKKKKKKDLSTFKASS